MSVKIKEIADTAQNSISPILCPLVDLSPIHMTWMLVCYNSRLFGRNQLVTVYGIFLTKTFKIDIIRSVVVSAHRKFSINFTLVLFVRCLCNWMTVKPFQNLSSQIKHDFFFKCTYSFSEMDLLVLQTNVPKMPAVRDESDQEISWDMFEDGFNFLPFNFLGIFCICTARGLWNKPIFNVRHFETYKLTITLQRLPPSHTRL